MVDPVLIVTGPTASGKTALAVEIALRLDGEIVSADSRQVYRGMDIGTAKPTLAERRGVPHHGFDRVSPGERYSAGRFGRDARRWIEEIRARGRLPIIAGGTGFFLRALTHPLFEEPPLDEIERTRLREALGDLPIAELERWVRALEPASPLPDAAGRGGAGRQRLLRAIEVALLTGRPLGWWHENAPARVPPVHAMHFVLEWPRDALDRRIDRRVAAMVEAGWPDEVRELVRLGFDENTPAMTATGYTDLLAFVKGCITLDEAVERTRKATRRFARRQATWFRNQLPADVVHLQGAETPGRLADRVERHWKERPR
ncbi:MAG: tRNA (adenosine(37)-N6)-dimethylallyltransferase MiaA [Gemmatimonadota bacterium]|jgi:tRNA dimethylallyltransferase